MFTFLLIISSYFHPFYVSVTEITQNEQTQTIQVSTRIFFDDLEAGLSKRYNTKVNILKPADKEKVNKLIASYISEKLKIKSADKEIALKFIGYEIEEEAAWCYFESAPVPPVKRLVIQNTILFEQHRSQINMIHAILRGKRRSTKLDNPKGSVVFSF